MHCKLRCNEAANQGANEAANHESNMNKCSIRKELGHNKRSYGKRDQLHNERDEENGKEEVHEDENS